MFHEPNKPLHRLVTRIGLVTPLVAATTGCLGNVSRDGEAYVYTSTIVHALMLLAIGGTIAGFGIRFILLGLQKEREPTRPDERKNTPTEKALSTLGGLAGLAGGAAIIGIGVPYTLIAHVTVHPDRVVMQDSVLWFANGDREISYASVAEFGREDKPSLRRRNQSEYLVIHFEGGSTEKIEMGARERAAFDKLVEAHSAYKSQTSAQEYVNPQSVAKSSDEGPYASTGPSNDDPQRDPSGPALSDETRQALQMEARFQEKADAFDAKMAESMAQNQAAMDDLRKAQSAITQPAGPSRTATPTPTPIPTAALTTTPPTKSPSNTAPRRLKRYVIDIPLPNGAVPVTAETPLVPGVKLGASYSKKWDTVTVMEVYEDGNVKCGWDNWGSIPRDMTRDDLIIAETVLNELRDQQAEHEPIQREWSDTTGDFKIVATYVDSKQGYVKLRKEDGSDVSVPIIKLSPKDRRIIAKLAQAMSK